MLVHAVISSRLDYCNSLLYGINKSVINKYQKVQNAAARIVAKKRKCESVANVLVNLHWLKVEPRIVFKLLLLTYKSLNNMSPVGPTDVVVDMIKVKDVQRKLLVEKTT